MSQPSITLGLKFQARVLTPQIAEKTKSQWLVATNCLKEENEVRVVEYDEDSETVKTADVFVHPPEVWDVAPNPTTTNQFLTVHNSGGNYGVTLWNATSGSTDLERVAELQGLEGTVRRVLWNSENKERVLTVSEGKLQSWSVKEGSVECSGSGSPDELQQLWSGTWAPSDANTLCTAGGNGFQTWDLRTMGVVTDVEGAHEMPVRDVDITAQNNGQILSCGDDCAVRLWDMRNLKASEPLSEFFGHSHWVWKCRFNPAHSQLALSSSSDSLVILWSCQPLGSGQGSPKNFGSPTSVLARNRLGDFDDHEDSVYGLSWSQVDPWVFASLSYDGRVVINKVPSETKYKILI